ncbi:hypothetical protein BT93_C0627 [Corymbia citriodora subsp. variegata]|nr:hypothetical protein BT93_C0627 [Corymbia citriodora subsp. variegata]
MGDADGDPVSSSMADPYRSKRVKRASRGQTLPGRPSPAARRNVRSLDGGGGGFSDGDDEDGGNYRIRQNPSYGYDYQNGHGSFSGGGSGAQGYVRKRGQENLVPAHDYEEGFPNQAHWSDYAKFTLLEVWGERFLQLGR